MPDAASENKLSLEQPTIAPTFELVVDDKKETIKMTFGRLNRVCTIIGNLSDVQRLILEPAVGNDILIELLSTKKNRVDPDELDISPEDSAAVLAWAGAHVLDFFIKLNESFTTTATPLMDRMIAVAEKADALAATPTSSTTGSKA